MYQEPRVICVGETGFAKSHYVMAFRGCRFQIASALCGTTAPRVVGWNERQAKSSTPVCNACASEASKVRATVVRSKDVI